MLRGTTIMFWSVWRHVANNVFGCVLQTQERTHLRITYYVLRITYYVDATPKGDATHAGPMGHGPCRPRTDAQNSAPKLGTKVKNPL